MSRRQDIIERSNDEYNRVLARCLATRTEILNQQRDALATVPAAKTALETYEAALGAGYEQYQEALATSRDELSTAENDAIANQADVDTAALETWRQATDEAETIRRRAIESAQQDYDDTYNTAVTLTGPARAAKLAEARAVHEAALTTAERNYRRDVDVAWRAYQKSSNAAREVAIATIEKSRRTQETAAGRGATGLERAQANAGRALRKALAAEPVALAIQEAFQMRLEQAERQCEREKADVLDRMKRDLAEAGP